MFVKPGYKKIQNNHEAETDLYFRGFVQTFFYRYQPEIVSLASPSLLFSGTDDDASSTELPALCLLDQTPAVQRQPCCQVLCLNIQNKIQNAFNC